MFPSPLGDEVLKPSIDDAEENIDYIGVSVPSRG